MAVSRKCDQCRKVKRCRFHLETVNGKQVITYLCAECLKELEAPGAPEEVTT